MAGSSGALAAGNHQVVPTQKSGKLFGIEVLENGADAVANVYAGSSATDAGQKWRTTVATGSGEGGMLFGEFGGITFTEGLYVTLTGVGAKVIVLYSD
jgi:hypothetical protein